MAADQPIRTCVGCRTRRPQGDLIRLHLDDRARIRVSRTGSGRGTWLCRVSAVDCFRAAAAGRSLERAFRRRLDRGADDQVLAELESRPIGGRLGSR